MRLFFLIFVLVTGSHSVKHNNVCHNVKILDTLVVALCMYTCRHCIMHSQFLIVETSQSKSKFNVVSGKTQLLKT